MALKWGGTNVTAVYWGSTKCSAVYWGSTLVFPGNGGKILYNGNTFFSPATRCKSKHSNVVFTSGTITDTYESMPNTTLWNFVFGGETSGGNYNSMDLSSYNYVIIEYNCTDSNNIYLTGLKLYYGMATAIDYINGKFRTWDISSVNTGAVKTSLEIYVRIESSKSGTINITKVIVC